jgi:hypothetical protein
MPAQKIILAFCLICFVSSGSREQQSVPPPPKPAAHGSAAPRPVPPPPKPADEGLSLEITMKFIQDKLNDLGTLRWTWRSREGGADHDDISKQTMKISNALADPQRCAISYHMQRTRDNKPTDHDSTINLKEVKKITVTSYEQEANDLNEGLTDLNPNGIRITIRPPIFTVRVSQSRKEEEVVIFDVDDEELAKRLARAMNHAVELCTPDKKPEPF